MDCNGNPTTASEQASEKKSDEKKSVVGLKVRLTKWSVLVEVQTVYVPSCPFDEMTL